MGLPVTTLPWQRAVDFLVLSFALYALLLWARRTRAVRLLIAIIALYLLSTAAKHFELLISSWLLQFTALLFAVTVLIAFQPELRRAILGLDNLVRFRPSRRSHASFEEIALAAFELARQKLGALILIVHRDPVDDMATQWQPFDSVVSNEILVSVFQHVSPLHDGAAIIEAARIRSVKAILPLSFRDDLPPELGTRHRAALGISERCDAVVVVVSEERQDIHVVEHGHMAPVADVKQLAAVLSVRLLHGKPSGRQRLKSALKRDVPMKAAAVALAALISAATFILPPTTVRTLSVPIEFNNLPPGLEISSSSATHVDVEVQGQSLLLDTIRRGSLVAHVDLGRTKAGTQAFRITPESLDLGPGIMADQISPDRVTVHLRSVTPSSLK